MTDDTDDRPRCFETQEQFIKWLAESAESPHTIDVPRVHADIRAMVLSWIDDED